MKNLILSKQTECLLAASGISPMTVDSLIDHLIPQIYEDRRSPSSRKSCVRNYPIKVDALSFLLHLNRGAHGIVIEAERLPNGKGAKDDSW